jgi:hypothetical protein
MMPQLRAWREVTTSASFESRRAGKPISPRVFGTQEEIGCKMS